MSLLFRRVASAEITGFEDCGLGTDKFVYPTSILFLGTIKETPWLAHGSKIRTL